MRHSVTLSTRTQTLRHWVEITSLQRQRARQCCHGYTYSSGSQFQAQRTPADYQSQNPEQTHAEGRKKTSLLKVKVRLAHVTCTQPF